MSPHKKLPTPQHLLLGSSIGAASLAFILGLFSTSKCQFVSTSFSLRFSGDGVFDDNNNPLTDDATTNLIQLSLGLFRHQQFGVDNGMFHVDNTCTSYTATAITVDTNWMAARTFGILALIIGGIHLLLLLLVSACIHSSGRSSSYEKMKRIMKIMSPWVYLLCCFFQGLTLLILNSQLCNNNSNNNKTIRQIVERLLVRATIQWSKDGCTMESGSKMATSSVVFWLVAGILSFLSNHFMNRMTTTVSDDLPDASTATAKNKVRNDCINEDERNDDDGNESQTRGGVQVHSSLMEDVAKKNDNDNDDCQDQDEEEAISPITTLKTTNSVGSKQEPQQQAASSIASTPKQSSPSTNNPPSSNSIITAPPRLGIISANNNATNTEKSNNLSPSIVSRNNMSVSSSPRVQSSSSSSVKGSYSPAGGGRRRARYR